MLNDVANDYTSCASLELSLWINILQSVIDSSKQVGNQHIDEESNLQLAIHPPRAPADHVLVDDGEDEGEEDEEAREEDGDWIENTDDLLLDVLGISTNIVQSSELLLSRFIIIIVEHIRRRQITECNTILVSLKQF